MGWSGGTYTKGNAGSGGWAGDASLGIGIEASRHDTQDNDFATGINNCLTKDGQNTPTANLPMGGYKHTGVGSATAGDEYLSYGQLLDVSKAVTTSGTRPNFTATLTPAPASYYDGMSFAIKMHESLITNAGATLNVNGLGAKDLKISTVGASVRDPFYAELSTYNTYIVTYSSDLDAFLIANPTFNNEIDFTPTWGVVGGGPVTLNSNFDTNYRWLGPKTVMVRTYCNLGLTSGTTQLTFALPFQADSDDQFVTGSGYITSLTGMTQYMILPQLYSNLTNMHILNNTIGSGFSTDAGFNVLAVMIYNVDAALL
jgi:hypothetical protein